MTRFTAAAVGICGVLAGIELVQAFGADVPRTFALGVASVSAVVAATVAVRTVAFVWRGPIILPFPREEATLCDAREASAVRSAAQLRGTMGGAGYLHPRRLALSATAWGAVSAQSVALVSSHRTLGTLLPLAVALAAAGLATLFPSDPFFYREAGGGCVLAFPPEVCRRLLDAAGVEPALTPVALGMFSAGRRGNGADASEPSESADEPEPDDARQPDPRSPV